MKLIIVAVFLLVGGYFAYSRLAATSNASNVATVQLEAGSAQLVLAMIGRVRSRALVDVRAERPGAITQMFHDEGNTVKAGEILAHIRSDEEQANLSVNIARSEALEAALNLARLRLKQTQTLKNGNLASQADLDEARASVDTAEADKRAAEATIVQTRARISEYDVRAPMSGIILMRPLDPGQVVGTTDVIFQIGSENDVEIEAEVDEYYADDLKTGMPALLSPSGSSDVFEAKLNEIAPRIDPLTGGRLVRFVIESDNKVFLPGRSVDINIEVETLEQALSIPRSALIREADSWTVYVVEDGKAVPRNIQFIDWPGGSVVVSSGLDAGDQVIVAPLGVAPGMTIQASSGKAVR